MTFDNCGGAIVTGSRLISHQRFKISKPKLVHGLRTSSWERTLIVMSFDHWGGAMITGSRLISQQRFQVWTPDLVHGLKTSSWERTLNVMSFDHPGALSSQEFGSYLSYAFIFRNLTWYMDPHPGDTKKHLTTRGAINTNTFTYRNQSWYVDLGAYPKDTHTTRTF